MGFQPPTDLLFNKHQLNLTHMIRLTHRKVSLELIYRSYNYKHYQHIAYVNIFYGLLRTFSQGPFRFCQQKPFSGLTFKLSPGYILEIVRINLIIKRPVRDAYLFSPKFD